MAAIAPVQWSTIRRLPKSTLPTPTYTPGQAPAEPRRRAAYFRTRAIVTAVWMAAFVICAVADALMAWVPAVPLWLGIAATVGALAGAVIFTRRYPAHVRARFADVAREG